jgi:hypothetical protein
MRITAGESRVYEALCMRGVAGKREPKIRVEGTRENYPRPGRKVKPKSAFEISRKEALRNLQAWGILLSPFTR